MKMKSPFWTGAMAAGIYLLFNIIADLLILRPNNLGELLQNSLSAEVIYSRLLGVVFIFLLAILPVAQRKSGTHDHPVKINPYPEAENEPGPVILETIAHQLKTSLTTIMGFTRLLKKGTISEESRGLYHEYIYSSSSNLLQTYYNLIDIQRISSNNVVLNREMSYNYRILKEIFHKYQDPDEGAGHSNVTWKLSVLEKDRNLAFLADEAKLRVVLENIIQNACAFTRDGIIEIGYSHEEQSVVRFFVKDSGKTASMEKFEQYYLNFSQNPKSLDANFNLAALRMVVARKYVELMGGELWSVPNKKRGTTYYFILPVLEKLDTTVPETAAIEQVPDWSGRTFLIAEDVEPNFLLLQAFLNPTQVQLIWAKNGTEAIKHFEEPGNHIDLILLDIIMPGLDGFEVASEIRKTNRSIPIIGQTAYTLENELDIEKLNNFNDFLTKPIWYHDLIKTISNHLV